MKALNYLLVLFSCILIGGCCALSKVETQKCKCKSFEKYLKSEFVLDKATGKIYINERIKEVTFENRIPLSSFRIIGKNKECFIGQSIAQLKRKIPLPTTRLGKGNSYYIYTSIDAFNCQVFKTDCDLVPTTSSYINIDFQATEEVKEVKFEIIGGKKYLLTLK